MKYRIATYGKYGVIWAFLWKYCPTDTTIWNLEVFRRWCIHNVYTLSFIFFVCSVPIVLHFLFVVYLLCYIFCL
jgi:hypothetical protein